MNTFPKCLLDIIMEYVDGDIYYIEEKLEKYMEKINWNILSANKGAIYFIERNQEKIYWKNLCMNENCYNIIEKNQEKIRWSILQNKNSKVYPFIIKKLEKTKRLSDMNMEYLCKHPYISNYCEILFSKFYEYINWYFLCRNPNINFDLLMTHKEKINWRGLSININSIHILEKNTEKINWDILNVNINAIDLLKKNMDKIDWKLLCKNINAIEIIKQKLLKDDIGIDWDLFCGNINSVDYLEEIIEYGETYSYYKKINWKILCENPSAISIIKKNLKVGEKYPTQIKVNLYNMCKNINSNEILNNIFEQKNIYYKQIMEEKYIWCVLSQNIDNIDIIMDNLDKIDWYYLGLNENFWDKYSKKVITLFLGNISI